jgi:hypothetical protein
MESGRGGSVLQQARGGRESDQRDQQRHWIDGASIRALGDERESLSAQHDGLQLELLLELFEREESVTVPQLRHRTMATTRLRLLYLAARITRHGGQTKFISARRTRKRPTSTG